MRKGSEYYFDKFRKEQMMWRLSWRYMDGRVKVFIILVVGLLIAWLLSGCATIGFQTPLSECDGLAPEESFLCKVAVENDLHLETVGNIVMAADLRAIKQGAYTAEQALAVFDSIDRALNRADLTANELTILAIKYVYNYPELILLMPYINYLKVDTPLTEKDIAMLRYWIDQNRQMLR